MLIVIADDITGAAEMAGIAHSHGLRTELMLSTGSPLHPSPSSLHLPPSTLLVLATDTRSMSEQEAVRETKRIAALLPRDAMVFKKVDSALRGHIVAELHALIEATGRKRAVCLPANPSKGRIVKDGIYYIIEEGGKRTPLSETAFSFDPEFPALSSLLRERFPDAEEKHIIMPDAENEDDMLRTIARYDDGKTLFAGAADLFALFIKQLVPDSPRPQATMQQPHSADILVLCGSTQSNPASLSLPIAPMPLSVYEGTGQPASWAAEAQAAYEATGTLILSIPYHHLTGRDVAIRLRHAMAEVACALIKNKPPSHLYIEGGATAFTLLQQLGWWSLSVVAQWAPGVVSLQANDGTIVTLKPGSYPWDHSLIQR